MIEARKGSVSQMDCGKLRIYESLAGRFDPVADAAWCGGDESATATFPRTWRSCRFCYAEATANLLTNPALDPFGKIPEFKFCAVRAERAEIQAAAE